MHRGIVFLIVSIILLGIDLYAYQGLKVAIGPLPLVGQRIIKSIFWGLTIVTIIGFSLFEPMSHHPIGRKLLTIMATIGVANILGKLLFALWLVIDDLIRVARYIWAKLNPQPHGLGEEPISRSEFLTQAGTVTAAVPLLAMGWGVVSGAHDYRVENRVIKLPNLPRTFDGLTITQISDIHCGSFWSKSAVKRGIELVNEQKSDAIFFTGDLVNNEATELNGWTEIFSTLKADLGVFSVLGNHDYGDYVPWNSAEDKRRNLRALMDTQRQMGWDLLIDENRKITVDGESISVVGVQNWGGRGRFPKYGDLNKALIGADDTEVKLLLSHDPSHWKGEVLPKYDNVDVMFSGHTHGMQFGIEVGQIKWSPVKYFYPEWADLYEENGRFLYVNRGFGYIGYPGRLGILPEITVITLKSA
ncbi:MAG: metallophosphoesterase [Flavobacteriales bacterium]